MQNTLAALFAGVKREKISGAAALIVPHAGYMYSGATAAAAYSAVDIPNSVVILAFNHRGLGPEISLWGGDAWECPLGKAEIDEEMRHELSKIENVQIETESHFGEHSGEVQIPFVKFLNADARVNVFSVNLWPETAEDLAVLSKFADGLAQIAYQRRFLLVCSTDLNHYENHNETLRRGELVISALKKLDPKLLVESCKTVPVTMCGRAPTVTAIYFAKAVHAEKFTVVDHTTSGPVSGDLDRTVGYLSGVFHS